MSSRIAEVSAHDEAAEYPKLAKKESDGMYAYAVQRRLSHYISSYCVRIGLSANAATGIDLLLAVVAAWSLLQGYYVLGVLFVQAFGLWSCVDGEIARLTNTQSALGDFYDTMTDRVAEFLIISGVFFSLPSDATGAHWLAIFIVYMGMVFLITASSEKFRSVYGCNYPKNEQEKIFSWLSAGSDTRLLYLSVAVLLFAVTGQVAIIEWLLVVLSLLLSINFIFRLWKIRLLSIDRPT